METQQCGSCGDSIGEDEWDECPLCGESISGNDEDDEDGDDILIAHLNAAEEEIERLKRQNTRLHNRIAKMMQQNKSGKKRTVRRNR